MLCEARTTTAPESGFSHRLARGLRRNLFQRFADQEPQAQQAWSAARTAAMPFRSRRDANAVARLASARMAVGLRDFRKAGTPSLPHYSGFELSRFDLGAGGELFENQIMVSHVTFRRTAKSGEAERNPIGGIGAHAIERFFQRRGTSHLNDGDDEICSALRWMDALFGVAKNLGRHRPICQVPIPTRNGVFLAHWLVDSSLIWARTWVCSGTNPRIDNTVAALRAWRRIPSQDPMHGFRILLAMPANHWLRVPYQPH